MNKYIDLVVLLMSITRLSAGLEIINVVTAQLTKSASIKQRYTFCFVLRDGKKELEYRYDFQPNVVFKAYKSMREGLDLFESHKANLVIRIGSKAYWFTWGEVDTQLTHKGERVWYESIAHLDDSLMISQCNIAFDSDNVPRFVEIGSRSPFEMW